MTTPLTTEAFRNLAFAMKFEILQNWIEFLQRYDAFLRFIEAEQNGGKNGASQNGNTALENFNLDPLN